MHVHPSSPPPPVHPPPQPERQVMSKDEEKRKKCKFVYLRLDNFLPRTVKVGNFDHLATFKIILKIFPNSFLTIFLHENVRVLWYFWDPNLQTRFGIAEVPYFLKNVGWSILPLIGLTSTTNDFFTINWKLGPSMARSTPFMFFKKNLRPQKLLGPKISSFKDTRSKLHLKYLGV